MGWQDAPIEETSSWQTAPQEQVSLEEPSFGKLLGRAKAFGKEAIEQAIPTAATLAGGIVGGAGGAALGAGVPGAIAGAAGGGLAGREAGEQLTELISSKIAPETKRMFGFDKETRARERANYPFTTAAAEYGPDIALAAKGISDMFKGTLKFAADRAIRNASPDQQKMFPVAQEWGLQLKPQQVLATGDRQVMGNAHNQRIINNKVAEATGLEKPEKITYINRDFLDSRFKDLSSQYDEIYSKGPVTLPKALINNIESIKSDPIAKLGAVEKKALDDLISPLKSDPFLTGAPQPVDGKVFQNAISKLKTVARESNDPEQRRQVFSMIDDLNTSLEKYNPQIAEQLNNINPKFRAVSTLDDIYHSNSDAVDKLGNIDAYELGRYIRTARNEAKTNPLKEIGEVGETLGIGANRSGTRYVRRAAQEHEFMPYQSRLNLLSKMKNIATDYNVGQAAQVQNPLLEIAKGTAGMAPLTYDALMGKQK